MKNMEKKTLTSAGPIDDCGRRWNIIYIVCAVAGAFLGIICGGTFGGTIVCSLLGLAVGWIIKSNICYFKIMHFRKIPFAISQQVPYPELTTKLISSLVPLGMAIENDADGMISITHRGVIYDVSYRDETSFTVCWRLNIARAFFKIDEIGLYRKVSQSTGIIAWTIQQICSAKEEGGDAVDLSDIGITTVPADDKQSHKKRIIKTLLIFVVVLILFLIGKALSTDDSMGISGMTFVDMANTMGEAVDQKPFCDATWANDGESTVWLTFNDKSGNAYEMCFGLFDKKTQARIDYAYMNGIELDSLMLDYMLDYLDSGNYDDFKSRLSAYGLLTLIF